MNPNGRFGGEHESEEQADRAASLAEYPYLEPEDFQQALRYAAATVDDERLNIDQVA